MASEPTMEDVRDLFIQVMTAHRQECLDPNCKESVNAIAFLCHCIFFPPEACIQELPQMVRKYEQC